VQKLWIACLMKNGHHNDAIFAEVIEERVGKSAQKNAAECAMRLMKREWMSLSQRDGFIYGRKEIVTEIV